MTNADVTGLLRRAKTGDKDALKSVYEILFAELERVARGQLNRAHQATINTHGLINESFLKLVEQERVSLDNRSHFLAVSAQAMRHILVDYFRRRSSQKRGGLNAPTVTLAEDQLGGEQRDDQLLALDEALDKLQGQQERLARVVECKFFAGMNYDEIGTALGISPRTVRQDWKKAKAWLTMELAS